MKSKTYTKYHNLLVFGRNLQLCEKYNFNNYYLTKKTITNTKDKLIKYLETS